jgi:type IV secretion system protein TrbL
MTMIGRRTTAPRASPGAPVIGSTPGLGAGVAAGGLVGAGGAAVGALVGGAAVGTLVAGTLVGAAVGAGALGWPPQAASIEPLISVSISRSAGFEVSISAPLLGCVRRLIQALYCTIGALSRRVAVGSRQQAAIVHPIFYLLAP